jgi:hypothetical protein
MRCKRCYMPFLFARSSLINYSMPALIAVISAWPRALRGVRIGCSARIRAGRGDNRNTRSPRRISVIDLTQRSQGSRTRFLANPFEQLPNDSQPTTHRRQHCRFLCRSILAFKRSARRGPNKSLAIYPHSFLNFARKDLGPGSSRAHSRGRHNGCKCGVEFQSNHFPNWLVTLP